MERKIGVKQTRTVHVKSIDMDAKTVTAYVSTFGWDRMDERFAKGSWRMDSYKKNPVVLWAHDQSDLPIAKTVVINEDDFGLLATAKFDEESEFAMSVLSLLNRGFLNAFSVGFTPLKSPIVEDISGTGRKGYVWVDQELLEFSVVTVPANPGALVPREFGDVLVKAFGHDRVVEAPGGYVLKSDEGSKQEDEPTEEDKTEDKTEDKKPEENKPAETPETAESEPADDAKKSAESTAAVLKSLTEMARTLKHEKLPEQQVQLLKSAVLALQEIVLDSDDSRVSKSEFDVLRKQVGDLMGIIKSRDPELEAARFVQKFMSAFDSAMSGFRTE